MKSFVIAILIGVSMISGCIIYTKQVEDVADSLKEANKEIIVMLEKDDFSGAEKAHSAVEKYLKDKMIMLAALGDHEEIDMMEIYLSQLCEYIKQGHKGDALATCEALDIMFSHMPKNYRLRAENIL